MTTAADTVMFTIATEGFVPFVRNLRASLTPFGLDRSLAVYALDDAAFEQLADEGPCTRCDVEGLQSWSNFKTPDYGRTMCFKYIVGLEILATGRNALYVDSDIVFLREPLKYLHTRLRESGADLLMQWEVPTHVYNAGFWLARPTPSVVDLFTTALSDIDRDQLTEDQAYLNRAIAHRTDLRVDKLDPNLFACANRFDVSVHFGWRTNWAPLFFNFRDAYLLHFNYVVGKEAKVRSLIRNRAVFWPGVLEGHHPEPRGARLAVAEAVQHSLRWCRGR